MQAILESSTTKFKQYYDKVEVNNDNPMYLVIGLDTRGLMDGEYLLTIYKDDNSKIAEEIVRVGEYKNDKTEYKIERKFIQYGK